MRALKLAAGAESATIHTLHAHSDSLPEPNGWDLYRDHTRAMLRKFFRMSLHLGRVPSMVGGQMFRGRVTVYEVHTFEDTVIFVHDMERCLERLDELSRILISMIVFQEYTLVEVADKLGLCERQVKRRLVQALNRTSEILIEAKLMEPLHGFDDGMPPKKPAASVR